MKEGGRLAAAIEVLERIIGEHRPVTDVLRDWGNAHRFAGSADRAWIGNIVHDALRRRASVAWTMADDGARALILGTYVRHWHKSVAAIEAAIAGDHHAPAALSEAEKSALDGRDLADAPDHVRGDYPEWLAPSLARAFADRAVTEGAALATRAPLDLRVNALKSDRDRVMKALARLKPVTMSLSPWGVRFEAGEGAWRAPNVQAEPGYQKGWFEIQDQGSQLAALLAGARPGDQVADICAGGGGKTLALAAMMANKGQIHAYDADRTRLAGIFERLKRAGVRNAQIIEPHQTERMAALGGRMDIVFVDAPCTGTGTWRRRPDAKWRLGETALQQRLDDQRAVLASGAPLVKPGGRLVYVTCSLLPEENEDQVAAFLGENPDFSLADPSTAWRAALSADLPDGFAAPVAGHGAAVRLTPANAGTDGFFIAIMVRGG